MEELINQQAEAKHAIILNFVMKAMKAMILLKIAN